MDFMKHKLAKPIRLADQVIKSAKNVICFKDECCTLKSRTQKLASLLHDMSALTRSEFYERPVHRIIDETEQVLDSTLSLVLKCCNNGFIRRVLVIIPTAEFRKVSNQLESCVADVFWLMGILSMDDDLILILPPIASNEPILAWVWAYISGLYYCSPDVRYNAVNELLNLSREPYHSHKLIVDEGGVVPLLKLLKEGRIEDQVIAAKTIGSLGSDSETIQPIIDAGVCLVFARILKKGAMEVQAEVAWAISQLVAKYHQRQDIFVQHNIIRLLVEHLAFETDHVQNVGVINKATSVLALVMAKTRLDMSKAVDECNDDKPYRSPPHQSNSSLAVTSFRGGHLEDPNKKAHLKAMVARALLQLAKSNSSICCSIAESRGMTSFAVLLEKGTEDAQYSSAMALMEMTAVAEQDTVLRRSAFRPSSPACKEVVDQLVKVIERQDTKLLIPCLKAIGNLARTFRVTETRIIAPLVHLLYRNEAKFSGDTPRYNFFRNTRLQGSFARFIRYLGETEAEICKEALMALRKFACAENHLHIEHSQTIVDVGGIAPIIQLVDSGDEMVQVPALILLCNIALHVARGEGLGRALNVIEWASKRSDLTQNEMLQALIPEAKSRLEIYYTSD